jgi:tetratricopeptide (TPR) repeat protein
MRALSDFLLDKADECLANLEKLLQQRPQLGSGWSLKGRVLTKTLRFEEAAEAFRRAIEIRSDFFDLQTLGHTQEVLGCDEEALTNFDKALQIRPDSFEVLCGKARVLGELGKTEEAVSIFDHALSLRPDSAEGWYERGSLLADVGQVNEALNSFNHAVKLNSNSHDYLHGKCWALAQQDRVEEALECVNMMLQLEPESADAYFWRGVLTITKDFNPAISDLRRAFGLKSSCYRLLVDGLKGRSLKLHLSLFDGNLDQLKYDWNELIEYARQQKDQAECLKQMSEVVTSVAKIGHLALAQELITSADLEQPVFPLARSIEYLLSGDDAVIERLSPEVKTIVDEIVATLKNVPRQ